MDIISKNVMSADNQQERLRNLNPWYITGFVEGEGTFHIAMYRDPKMKYRIKIIPEFHINQSYLRINTLQEIKSYFCCGYIKENHKNRFNDVTFVYVVRDRNDLLRKIIPFFKKYPLLSIKQKSFELFSEIVKSMSQNQHSTIQGVKEIIQKAFLMNNSGKYRKNSIKNVLGFLKSSETIRRTHQKGEKI